MNFILPLLHKMHVCMYAILSQVPLVYHNEEMMVAISEISLCIVYLPVLCQPALVTDHTSWYHHNNSACSKQALLTRQWLGSMDSIINVFSAVQVLASIMSEISNDITTKSLSSLHSSQFKPKHTYTHYDIQDTQSSACMHCVIINVLP